MLDSDLPKYNISRYKNSQEITVENVKKKKILAELGNFMFITTFKV